MELAILLLKQLASLFIMIALGYLMVKIKLMRTTDSKALSAVLIYVISPCMIFNSYQIGFSQEVLHGLVVAILVALGIHLLYMGLLALLKRTGRLNGVELASIMYVNAGNLLIPLVSAALGSDWLIYTTPYILVETPLLWTHCLSTVREQKAFRPKQVFTNVNIIAVFAGLLFFLMNWRLPDVLSSTVSALASMIAPVNMLMLGVMMAGYDLKEMFSRKRAYWVSLIRLVVCPLLVIVLIRLTGVIRAFPLGKSVLLVSLLAAAAPSAAAIVQQAQFYDKDSGYAGAISIISSICCIVTIPLMVLIYQLAV